MSLARRDFHRWLEERVDSGVKIRRADPSDLVIDLTDSDGLAGEEPAQVDFSSAYEDAAAMGHANGFVVVRVWRFGRGALAHH